jgi:MtN3 and saliva related transmembrane protein
MQDLIGSIAAILTTASFLPQAILVLRTRNTESLSLIMYAMFTAGVLCWLIYGLMISSTPIIVANLITIVLAAIILSFKIQNTLCRYRAGKPPIL